MNDPRGEPKRPNVEGELYKRIEVEGKTLDLYYGYYEEKDRLNPLCEPIPIYPDFTAQPEYTDGGYPFATDMQDACEHYRGNDREGGCFGCVHYKRGEEFLGVCTCESRRKNE